MLATRSIPRLPLLAVLCGITLLSLRGGAPAAAQISVTPALPTTHDAIALLAPACIYQGPPRVEGNVITLTGFTVPPPCGAPLWIPARWSYPLPPLAAGSYTVQATAGGTTTTTVFEVVEPSTVLYLVEGGRFAVTATFSLPSQGAAPPLTASTVPLSDESGYFWFVDSANLELGVKILDGQAVNGHFWVFIASLTDLPCTVKITDQSAAVSGTCHIPGKTAADCSVSYVSTGGTNRNFIDLGTL